MKISLVFIFVLAAVGAKVSADSQTIKCVLFGRPSFETVDFSSARSMVRLSITKRRQCSVCSGSFVAKNWILTSAHCVYNANSVVADVGGHFNSSCFKSYVINKTEIIVHPSFKRDYNWVGYLNKRSHDIALIKFMEETSCKPHWIVRLPGEGVPRQSYYNARLEFIRFGESCNTSPPTYFTKPLRVVGDDRCKRKIVNARGRRVIARERMEEDQMCILTGLTMDTCYGDTSGHIFKNGTEELIGIMSRQPGQQCLRVNQVTFTRVSYYISWIKSYLGEGS